MNEHQLSQRLSEVSSFIPTGSRIVDVGSDHAYLPVYLALQGKISFAIAGEVNEGPFQTALTQVERLGLEGVVEVRKGDGLDVIEHGEVDVICIAGMGGKLIVQILDRGRSKLENVQRLIIQPNVAAHQVREWFLNNNWELKEERMVEEEGMYYEILMAEPGEADAPYQGLTNEERERAILMGPYLLQTKPEAFHRKWEMEVQKRKNVLASLEYSQSAAGEEKGNRVLEEIKRIKEGLSK